MNRACNTLLVLVLAAPLGLRAQDSPPVAEPEPAAEPIPPLDQAASPEAVPPENTSGAESAETVEASIPVASTETKQAEPAATTPSGNRLLGEIIVTAQKREELLQDVPISVQAFSSEALDARGVDDPKDLQLSTPSLQYNFLAAYSIIYLRGVGTDAFIPSADGSVATYIDGVYYPFTHGLAQSFGALERIEVLKGPQGTLFGRNSTAGAINVITRKPALNKTEAEVQVSFGNYDQMETRAHINIPLHETLSFSVSGLYNKEDNYYDLIPSGTHTFIPEEVSRGYRAKVRWAPVDELDITLTTNLIRQSGSQFQMIPAGEVKPLGAATGVTVAPEYKTGEDLQTYYNGTTRVHVVDATYVTPWFDTRFIGADQRIDTQANADFDGSSAPVASFEAKGQFGDIQTGELQFLSNDESWGSDWLKWIGGLYYIESSAGYDPLFFTLAPGAVSTLVNPPADGPLSVLRLVPSPLRNFLSGIPEVPLVDFVNNGVNLSLDGILDTESTAVFAQATADITDWVALTVGGRYQEETREIVASTVSYLPNPDNPDAKVLVCNFNSGAGVCPLGRNAFSKKDTDNFSPKAVLDFKLNDYNMVYLSYSKGFKSGTFNIISIYAPTQYIEPEEVTTYELGYKGTLLDGSLRFAAAAFFNDVKNLQVQTISLTSGGAVRFENAGKAEIKGVDFDLVWQLFPEALPGLVLSAAGAYLDGEYTDFKEGSGFNENTGLFFDGTIFPTQDFTGNETVRTPEFSGTLGLGYTFPLGPGSLEIAGDVYHNSGFFYSSQNLDTVAEDSYEVVNARISYLYEPWDLRVTAFGKNINDGKYHYAVFDADFSTWYLRAPPSTYGLRMNWTFGG